jgi:hypothetical protein
MGDFERYRVWTSLVENYTRRKLTYPEDRLPAIGGIAQKLRDAWEDEYYAGIWKGSFIDLLAWRRNRKSIPGQYTVLEKYRAPSWSWASVEGPIEYAYSWRVPIGNLRNLKAEFLVCETVPATENRSPFGEIRAGELTLRGSLIRCNCPILTDLTRVQGWGDMYPDNFEHPLFKEWKFSRPGTKLHEESSFLLLGSGPDGSGGKLVRTVALILMPVADGRFERVGLFETSYKSAHKAWASPKDRQIVRII